MVDVILHQKSALLLIDLQDGFDDPYWGSRNNPLMEERVASLLHAWRGRKLPVIHIQHSSTEAQSPLRVGQLGHRFKVEAAPLPTEQQFEKQVNSAFIGTVLESYLHGQGIEQLVIAGLTTDHCVSTTTRMAGNLGFDVLLVADACATFDRVDFQGVLKTADEIHQVHLASLHGEFCTVCLSQDILSACS